MILVSFITTAPTCQQNLTHHDTKWLRKSLWLCDKNKNESNLVLGNPSPKGLPVPDYQFRTISSFRKRIVDLIQNRVNERMNLQPHWTLRSSEQNHQWWTGTEYQFVLVCLQLGTWEGFRRIRVIHAQHLWCEKPFPFAPCLHSIPINQVRD